MLTLASCSGDGGNITPPITNTTGAVTFTKDAATTATVTNSSGAVVTNYSTLTPGTYTVVFSRSGFVSSSPIQFTIVAGETVNVQSPTLAQVGATTGAVSFIKDTAVTATVRDANGATVAAANYNTLAPGNYTVVFSRDGFTPSGAIGFAVEAGRTTTVTAPTLTAVGSTTTTKNAYYLDANGQIVPITSTDPARFRFVSWLENGPGGVNPDAVGTGAIGTPTADEQDETAPSNTQNIAGGYVTYRLDNGTEVPVVGSDVRWDITEQTGSVRFAAADDGGNDSGAIRPLDINANALSALTWTNRAGNNNILYPASATYPTTNLTGVNTPDRTGYTWTALSHDPNSPNATARIRVIAYVNGREIDKQFLTKRFAPSARLEIVKERNQESTPGAPGNFTITVRNVGQGAATGVRLTDRLTSGNADLYSLVVPAGATAAQGNDGFDAVFDLAPGATRTFAFQAAGSDAGVFCDTASVASFTNGAFGVVTPVAPALTSQACLTVRAPRLTVVKSLVDAAGNPIGAQTVAAGQDVRMRITVRNGGDLAATGVVLTDALTTGAAANYSITQPTNAGVTANGDDGFTTAAQTIAPGAAVTYDFPARATADGQFCDTATVTSTNAGTPAPSQACFTVATARLAIAKTNAPTANLFPGSSYDSTIVVTNTGTAAATTVNVQDIIGSNAAGQFLSFASGSYTVTGTAQAGSVSFAGNTATIAPTNVTIPAGGNLTLRVTTTIPAGTRAGEYCDVASFTSANSQPANGQARACVTVSAFIGEQTQLTDTTDPIRAGGATTELSAAAIVELTSNQGARNNVFRFNFGTRDPANFGAGGVFNFSNVRFFYDPTPTRDAETGAITSDFTSPTAAPLSATLSATSGTGVLVATFDPNFVIQPGGVVYSRISFGAPAGTSGQYQEVFRWENNAQDTGEALVNQKAESTTVIP